MRSPDSRDGGGIKEGSKGRDNLICGASVGLVKNQVLGKFPGIHKVGPR